MHRGVVTGRAKTALMGALFGTALAVLYDTFTATPPAGSAPQTIAAWAAFYAGLGVPWALIGDEEGERGESALPASFQGLPPTPPRIWRKGS